MAIGKLDNLEQYDFAAMGSPLLVNNGAAVWDYYRQVEETASDIGRDAAGNLLVAVSDGRTKGDQGLTLEEMALYMLDKGAVWAINGGSGSSSVIADQTGGLNQSQNVGANAVLIWHKEIG